MADISLRMLADASNATGAFKDFGSAITAAGSVLAGFAKDSIKAYADSERQLRQLRAAAGEYTDALSEQAEVLKQKYAVDDDQIRHMETLLLRYGAAPAQIKSATEAVLNYAAATGKDAVQATEMLVRGVEAGHGSLGRIGVSFKETGKFSTDLGNAVDALGKKFAGAADADANSLDGKMRKVSLATDDFKKALGSMFATIEQKTGLLDKLTNAVNQFSEGMKRPPPTGDGLLGDVLGFFGVGYGIAETYGRGGRPNAAQQAGLVPLPPEALPTAPLGGDHEVGKAPKEKNDKGDFGWGPFGDPEKDFAGWEREYQEYAAKQDADMLEQALKMAADENKARDKEEKEEQKHDDDTLKSKRLLAELEIQNEEDKQKKLEMLRQKAEADEQRRFKKMEDMWRQAGDRMGAALVGALDSQLQRLMEGGDSDPAEIAGDIASTLLSILGSVIGSELGSPQLGSAIGGLAGHAAKIGIVQSFGKKHHDGGWIERFHGGGWPGGLGHDEQPAILQTGERVLSRREVSAMGGPAGVDRAARGRSGVVVNITTQDSQSFLDSYGRDGGRGFFDAIRVGRGDLLPLFNG
jgi:hypothetical protein